MIIKRLIIKIDDDDADFYLLDGQHSIQVNYSSKL